jgi:hypothetical protein
MKKITDFFNSNFSVIAIIMLVILLMRTCNNDVKVLTKRVDSLQTKIDSLQAISVTSKDLRIEGLKSEKRMIQSTDRKILDVNRQSEIDKEIEALSK